MTQKEKVYKILENNFDALDSHHEKATNEIMEIFKPKIRPLQERKDKFYTKLATRVDKFGKTTVREFYDYWTEHGENDKKMRFEKEKSFDINKRLARWSKNNKLGDEKFVAETETHQK